MSGEGDFVYMEVQDLDLLDEDPDVSVDRDAGDMDKSRGESVDRSNHTQNKDSKSHSWKQNSHTLECCLHVRQMFVCSTHISVCIQQVSDVCAQQVCK